jgi:predicted pyridoxine 5'-phosphate oxidase superfamily flavin-nucleotide-binding protein
MRIPEHIRRVIDGQDLHVLATASREGVPNVVYVRFLRVFDDEHILIADNKFFKTAGNLGENPRASFVVLDRVHGVSYQIKGTVEFHRSGRVFDEVFEWVESEAPDPLIRPKAAVLFDVEEIYCGEERLPEE